MQSNIEVQTRLVQSPPMGWMRTMLLGDIGNRLDIADTEADIYRIERTQQRAADTLNEREREIAGLKDELGRQKLATQALARFLIEKGIIRQSELDEFIAGVDAEDGVVDGRMAIDSLTRRLHFPTRKVPDGTFRKSNDV